MCGRYTLVLERETIEERFDARFARARGPSARSQSQFGGCAVRSERSEREPREANGGAVSPKAENREKRTSNVARRESRRSGTAHSPRYNAAPGQRLPVITNERPETIRRLMWGLVPAWADDGSGGHINARAETAAEKPSFRDAHERRRALVPADGFYEWVETGDGKRPYRVTFEDGRPFAMAGLWERWEPETAQTELDAFGGGAVDDGTDETADGNGVNPLETFAIVTTEPNDLVGDLHHRMAAILEPEVERQWLTGAIDAADLEPYPADGLRAYPVSRTVNDPANDDPSLIDPLEGPI